jgi:hypothetical protein
VSTECRVHNATAIATATAHTVRVPRPQGEEKSHETGVDDLAASSHLLIHSFVHDCGQPSSDDLLSSPVPNAHHQPATTLTHPPSHSRHTAHIAREMKKET